MFYFNSKLRGFGSERPVFVLIFCAPAWEERLSQLSPHLLLLRPSTVDLDEVHSGKISCWRVRRSHR